MPTLSQRLRELDRRVLRQPDLTPAEGWARSMGRWRLQLGVGVFCAVAALVNVAVGNGLLAFFLLPSALMSTFLAGRMRTEHERATGKTTFMGKPRPPGV